MKFEMNDLNPGAWFYFDDAKPDDGKICVRVLNAKVLAEIRNKTIETKVEYKNGNRFEYQKIDHNARDHIIWNYCICDWEGLVDDDENPIECTTENKIKLMNEHIGFSTFVENCLTRLNKELEIFAAAKEKNLSTTPLPL